MRMLALAALTIIGLIAVSGSSAAPAGPAAIEQAASAGSPVGKARCRIRRWCGPNQCHRRLWCR